MPHLVKSWMGLPPGLLPATLPTLQSRFRYGKMPACVLEALKAVVVWQIASEYPALALEQQLSQRLQVH